MFFLAGLLPMLDTYLTNCFKNFPLSDWYSLIFRKKKGIVLLLVLGGILGLLNLGYFIITITYFLLGIWYLPVGIKISIWSTTLCTEVFFFAWTHNSFCVRRIKRLYGTAGPQSQCHQSVAVSETTIESLTTHKCTNTSMRTPLSNRGELTLSTRQWWQPNKK